MHFPSEESRVCLPITPRFHLDRFTSIWSRFHFEFLNTSAFTRIHISHWKRRSVFDNPLDGGVAFHPEHYRVIQNNNVVRHRREINPTLCRLQEPK